MIGYAIYGLVSSNPASKIIPEEKILAKEEIIPAPAQKNTRLPVDNPSLVGKLEDYVLQKETGRATQEPQQQDLLKEKEALLKQNEEQLNKFRDENVALKKKLLDNSEC